MITNNLATLKIHKLSQAQYDRELAAGRIDENAIYITPDEGAEGFEIISNTDINKLFDENGDEPDPVEERLEGDGQEFYTTAPSTLSFRSTAPLNELQDVQINGQTVNPSNYELEEGSTIVKLKHDYLSTLDTGSYELAVVSDSKTVKGDFTVAAPELNEYGFYYGQPYTTNEEIMIGLDLWVPVFIFRPNEVKIINRDSPIMRTLLWSYQAEKIVIDAPRMGANGTGVKFTLEVADLGKTLTGSAVAEGFSQSDIFISCALDNVVSDSVYLYIEEDWGIEYYCINDAAVMDSAVASNIRSKTVTYIGCYAYSYNTYLTSIVINDGIRYISDAAFRDCSNLTYVSLPNTLEDGIGSDVFSQCSMLTTIEFRGTISEWNNIVIGVSFTDGVPATHVHCIDGDVEI